MLNFNKVKDNLIHQTAVINWKKISIGKGNIIGPYIIIGNNAQHPKLKNNGIIRIGDNNVFTNLPMFIYQQVLKKNYNKRI